MRDPTRYRLRLLALEGRLALYRGTRDGPDAEPLLFVRPLAPDDLEAVALLENAFALSRTLDTAFAAPALELNDAGGTPTLVLADPGGEPLSGRLGRPLPLASVLSLAFRLAEALGAVHGTGIIHTALRPAVILVDEGDGVRLTGFGHARRVARPHHHDLSPEPSTPAAPYMSPEQSGRMHRTVDARSDLYALGVILYEMLTGTLPFAAEGVMEWVHAHVARQPTSPGRYVPHLPAVVADIVMTLLAKAPEERYQTARGLAADLAECLARLSSDGRIAPFPLRRRDVRDRMVVPDRLYGRETEIGELVAAYDRMTLSGSPELVLVSGYSGVGKSALVAEFFALLAPAGVRIVAGKFDQVNRGVPFATLTEGFERAIRTILAADEAERTRWRSRLVDALGANAGLVTSLIPELALLIGPSPPVPPLSAQEAQHRFRFVFERFLAAFATPGEPLVVFLDDLQWVDPATASLIERLVVDAPVPHLFLVGAYRVNEVGQGHPFAEVLARIRASRHAPTEVMLGPLSVAHVTGLVADALGTGPSRVADLAEIIVARTTGNPFYVVQLLETLVERSIVRFDAPAAQWRYDADEVRAAEGLDIASLMVASLHRLSDAACRDLRRFAAHGMTARADVLASVLDVAEAGLEPRLAEAVEAGLVLRRSGAYSFLHDQVQEAAYRLVPEEERAALHLAIGRTLGAALRDGRLEDATFETANQLNRGLALITGEAERLDVARLDVAAAAKANASGGHGAALGYLAAAREVLGDLSGEADRLRFEVEIACAECELLSGDHASAERRLAALAAVGRPVTDAARIAWQRITIQTASGRLERAVALCLEYLRWSGIDWSAHPSMEALTAEFAPIRAEIDGGRIEERLALPGITDPEALATVEVLTAVLPPAFFTDQTLVCLVLCRMANISARHGNSAASALGYAYLGMVLGPVFGDYAAGYRFGRLGIDISERPGFERFRARTLMTFAYHVLPYSRPLATGRDPLRRAFELARETGDLTYSGYSTCTLISNLLAAGEPLGRVERQAERGLAYVRSVRFGLIDDIVTTQLMLTRALRGLTYGPATFADGVFDEEAFERRLAGDPTLTIAACWHHIRKLQAAVFAGDNRAAREAARRAEPLLWTTGGHLELVEFHFYDAIARADGAGSGDRAAIEAHRDRFRTWAENCPANFLHHLRLIEAELARLSGAALDALRLYDDAVRSARANGFTHIEALAHERAAVHCAASGLETVAELHLARAQAAYRRWGADSKLRPAGEAGAAPAEAAPARERPGDTADVDLATIVRSSEALSGAAVLADLIRTLMTLVLENAGAQRGVLILIEGERLWSEAEASTEADGFRVTLRRRPASAADVPLTLIDAAIRSRSSVLVGDAATDHPFREDPYLATRAPRSILALPLVRQGKLRSLIYLENEATANTFTPARLAVLRLIAAQAAISLENAVLEEKESLLKEVHHRVKNNLQLISSLLNLQAARSADATVAEHFAESRNRVRAMALVHENLYRAGSFARISMADHLRSLCAHLVRSYAVPQRRVSLAVEAEEVTLDLDRAVSCGLIVNELVSNALKHAFPGARAGRVGVSLRMEPFDRCILTVEDDGIGLPEDWRSSESLGLQLVRDLADQLGGRIDVTLHQGTRFMIHFDLAAPGGEPR
ncbi:AAA family ATPase [Acuticoccus sediminis]|uniref:AAA family ATPase n=1 Tax=Acuticoccus sediminis TaxID=2184697 RepID=UPI001CFC84DC|nr:AAA family ATPase [Acuticoccus sediminis]